MPPPNPQHWSDYIQLSESFVGPERAALVAAFDAIAAVPDGEGMALLRMAAERRGQRLLVTTGSEGNLFIGDHIEIDFTKGLVFEQPGRDGGVASLTGVLVHELFHAVELGGRLRGDTGPTLLQQLDAPFTAYLQAVPEAMRLPLQAELKVSTALTTVQMGALLTVIGTEAVQEDRLVEGLRLVQLPRLAEAVAVTGRAPLRDALQQAGILAADGVYMPEHRATLYTDAFMAKYFPQEPQRGHYLNGIPTESVFAVVPPLEPCRAAPSEGLHVAEGLPVVLPSTPPDCPAAGAALLFPGGLVMDQLMPPGVRYDPHAPLPLSDDAPPPLGQRAAGHVRAADMVPGT